MSPTSWMQWALVLRTRCPPLRRPVPRPGGVVVLQCLHRLVQDMPLVRRLLLLVLQVLQVPDSLRLRFRSHATDDKPASMGINGAFLVNTPLRVSTPTLATPAVAASGHHGAPIRVRYHACANPLPAMIPRWRVVSLLPAALRPSFPVLNKMRYLQLQIVFDIRRRPWQLLVYQSTRLHLMLAPSVATLSHGVTFFRCFLQRPSATRMQPLPSSMALSGSASQYCHVRLSPRARNCTMLLFYGRRNSSTASTTRRNAAAASLGTLSTSPILIATHP